MDIKKEFDNLARDQYEFQNGYEKEIALKYFTLGMNIAYNKGYMEGAIVESTS